jgi:hydrogenase maturation factor
MLKLKNSVQLTGQKIITGDTKQAKSTVGRIIKAALSPEKVLNLT